MTLALAILGWMIVTLLALQCTRLSVRLELVARADHELRGPVCALALAIEALRRNPELRRRGDALEAHLDRLSLGLADLAAARVGRRAAPRPRDVRLEGVARAVTEAWKPAVRSAGREISFDWRAGGAVAHADPARLSQALGNLVANAVEHGGDRIAVVGERHAEGVRIAVRDSGREPERRTPIRQGGRGLAIAADALDHTSGALVACQPTGRCSPPGRGTEVRIELPVVETLAG